MPDLSQLSARLGYGFTNVSLLETAMHHRSWNAENDGGESNERLEFLGDAVLGWVVADIVYTQHSDLPEGKLTDLRIARFARYTANFVPPTSALQLQ